MKPQPRKSWSNRPSSSATRLRGRALQQARAELFSRNPLCVSCPKKGITRLATERDHVIPLFEGGTDDASNTVGLCNPCHKEKTQQESNRARGITTKPRMRSGCDESAGQLIPIIIGTNNRLFTFRNYSSNSRQTACGSGL
jgi:5-methylcytosine-specific restriction protein A